MRNSIQRYFVWVSAITLVIALPALAQQVQRPTTRAPILVENPYRTSGGSCIYGRLGELVYAPSGSACESKQAAAPEQTEAADRFKGLSPALRAEMMALLEGHSHIAEELAALRLAVAQDRKDAALQASDHVVRELTDLLAREQRMFEKLSAAPASQGK